MRWLPLRERFYGNCISCTSSRQTFNALERRHASLKIESQLSIDEELASIERVMYSGRRLMAARARAPAAHLHTGTGERPAARGETTGPRRDTVEWR